MANITMAESGAVAGMRVGATEQRAAGEQKNGPPKPAEAARLAAEAAKLKATVATVDAWKKIGKPLKGARNVLQGIALENAKNAAEAKVVRITEDLKNAPSEKAVEQIKKIRNEAVREQQKAEQLLGDHKKRLERMRKSPKAPVADRLFAYDMELAQNTLSKASAEAQFQDAEVKLKSAVLSPEARAQYEAVKKQATEDINTANTNKTTLEAERKAVGGTKVEQNTNHVAAVALKLNGAATTAEQRKQIMEDPMKFLETEAAKPGGLLRLAKNSGISETDQAKLLSLASGEAITKFMKTKNNGESVFNKARQGFLALLILLYTAYGANKKAKGQQMG